MGGDHPSLRATRLYLECTPSLQYLQISAMRSFMNGVTLRLVRLPNVDLQLRAPSTALWRAMGSMAAVSVAAISVAEHGSRKQ
jgi:hypothetical protein